MTTPPHRRTRGRLVVALFLPVCFAFWFVTALASMAVQRITCAGNGGTVARIVCSATDWYESPMIYFGKIPALRRMNESMANKWCEILDAPETTS